jgi:hypothetical protein
MLRDAYGDDTFSLCLPGDTVIGRGKSCDIVINHGSVSKKHAIISLYQDEDESISEAWIEDTSSFGTFVGPQGQEKRILKKTALGFGNYIRFGNMTTGYFFENISQNSRVASREELNLTDQSGMRVPLEMSPEPPIYSNEYEQVRGSGFQQRQDQSYESGERTSSQNMDPRIAGAGPSVSPGNSYESNRYSEYDDNRRSGYAGEKGNLLSSDEGIPWNFQQPVPRFDGRNDPSRSSPAPHFDGRNDPSRSSPAPHFDGRNDPSRSSPAPHFNGRNDPSRLSPIPDDSPLHGEHLYNRDFFPAPKLSSSLQLPPSGRERESTESYQREGYNSHSNVYGSGHSSGYGNIGSSADYSRANMPMPGVHGEAHSDSGPMVNRMQNTANQVRHSLGAFGTHSSHRSLQESGNSKSEIYLFNMCTMCVSLFMWLLFTAMLIIPIIPHCVLPHRRYVSVSGVDSSRESRNRKESWRIG